MKLFDLIKYLFCIFIFIIFILLILQNTDVNIEYDTIDYINDYYEQEHNVTSKKAIFKPQFYKCNNNKFVHKYNKDISTYNDSIILNKIKDMHFKNVACKQNAYNKISQLEMQINKDKIAYRSLIKDVDDIIKEFES